MERGTVVALFCSVRWGLLGTRASTLSALREVKIQAWQEQFAILRHRMPDKMLVSLQGLFVLA